MGRPREHDELTRRELRASASRLVAEGGPAAFSVRAVADEANTTTRAVYSLFGSGEALLVDVLAQGAYDFLANEISALDETGDPVSDLLDVGRVFRRLVVEKPMAFRIAFQRVSPAMTPGPELSDARERAWSQLLAKVQRVGDAGLLGDKSAHAARVEFNAMLEGLGNAELRGAVFPNLPDEGRDHAWRSALATLVRGFNR